MVGQPDTSDWTFNHTPDATIESEYGPNDPFWITYLRKTIVGHGVTTTEPEPDMLEPLRNLLAKALSHDQFLCDSIEHTTHRIKELKKYEKRGGISPHPNPSRTTPPGYRALSTPHVAQLLELPIQNMVTQNPFSTLSPGHNPIQKPSPS